jgi:putative ABC transport system permease protein
MKLPKLFRLAWLELVRFKSSSVFLILNLTLGLIGFFILQIFQHSLTLQSEEKAQTVLGGDISINARRAFSEEERLRWESKFKYEAKTQQFWLSTMLRNGEDTRLVTVGVFDSHFPLYGKFRLSGRDFTDESPLIWADPEVKENLRLEDGQMIAIGDKQFKFAGTIEEDPTRLFQGLGFAPIVMISQRYFADTNLLKMGSTFNEEWNYKLPAGTDTEPIKKELFNVVTDPSVRIQTTEDSASDSNRVLKYFVDYLGLVALVALGLSFLCGTYLLQWTFLNKRKTIAIYKTLGLSNTKIVVLYLVQNFIVSFMACVLSYLVVLALLPVCQKLLIDTFNLPLNLVFSAQATIITLSISLLGPFLMVVPQIIQIVDLRPLMLLQSIKLEGPTTWAHRLWLLFSVAVFWSLAVWQSHSLKVASLFTGSVVGLIIVFRYLTQLLLFLLEKFSVNLSWDLKYAVKGLTRKPASAALVFTTMSLATMVLSLLPHIKTSIVNEVRPENQSLIPSLFLFDVQPEQTAGIQQLAQNILGQDLFYSPLVRSRILKINEEKYERTIVEGQLQTREEDQEARFRNRGVNLTYRSSLQDSEVLVRGEFNGIYEKESGLPEISLETDYADRMKIKIGDVMTFDVQGLEIKAKVTSLRKVKWTSFQPNFFILFPQGVLEEAPQMFLTSVKKANTSNIKNFQSQVADGYRNVSIIDINRTVEKSLKYVDQMALGLQLMAWLAVIVGLFVFIVLLNTQVKERLYEMNLLQIMGAPSGEVFKIVSLQFLVLLTGSVLFGVLLGLAMAWVLISYFFKIGTEFDGQYLVLLITILFPVCGFVLYSGLRPLKRLNPMDLIRSS